MIKYCVWSGAKVCTSCRLWKMLSNAYFWIIIFLQNFVLIQPRTSPPKICKKFRKMHFSKMHFRKMHSCAKSTARPPAGPPAGPPATRPSGTRALDMLAGMVAASSTLEAKLKSKLNYWNQFHLIFISSSSRASRRRTPGKPKENVGPRCVRRLLSKLF